MLPLEIFWILTPQSFLFWASESFRQDIGQFHSPRMKPCKSADDFIKVNFYVERKGYDSLRGRCLKGKRFLGARETQGAHKEGGCLYNAKNNSYVVSWQAFPFLFPHIPPPPFAPKTHLPFQTPAMQDEVMRINDIITKGKLFDISSNSLN